MKAQDLMVGDLVTFPDSLEDGEIVKVEVVGIIGDSVYGIIDDSKGADEIDVEELCGIPLTPEILEKNWFKVTWGWHKLEDCPFWLVKYTEKSWAKGKFGVMLNEDDDNPSFLIRCVHELQHALRLCGIEKEIVL